MIEILYQSIINPIDGISFQSPGIDYFFDVAMREMGLVSFNFSHLN